MIAVAHVPLGDLMARRIGSVNPEKFPDETFDLYSIPAFDSGEPEIARGSEIGSSKQIVSPGDILLSKIVPHIRRSWVVGSNNGRRLIASGEWIVFRSVQIDQRYLRHFLISDPFHTQFMRTVSGVGGSLLRAKPALVAHIEIPLPNLSEQRRIATILDQADALRVKRREALAQLDGLTQSIFMEMFGDPATNPKGWPRKKAGSVGKVITGNTPPRAISANYGDAIEWIKSDNINTPHYYLTLAEECLSERGKSIARIAPAGSILVTCIAGSPECIGNVAMADREVAFNQQINAFIPESGDPHFYYAQFVVGKKLIQEASTGGMKGMVSKGRFEQISLIVPPIDLQSEFTFRIAKVNELIFSHQKSYAELETLFSSLQHRAFRGEL